MVMSSNNVPFLRPPGNLGGRGATERGAPTLAGLKWTSMVVSVLQWTDSFYKFAVHFSPWTLGELLELSRGAVLHYINFRCADAPTGFLIIGGGDRPDFHGSCRGVLHGATPGYGMGGVDRTKGRADDRKDPRKAAFRGASAGCQFRSERFGLRKCSARVRAWPVFCS